MEEGKEQVGTPTEPPSYSVTVHESVTLPVKPPLGVIVSGAVAEPPTTMVGTKLPVIAKLGLTPSASTVTGTDNGTVKLSEKVDFPPLPVA
jgi:hypothetical protein